MKKNDFNHFQKGFTLIELVVVLLMIGVIAVMVLVSVDPLAQLQKSNDTRRKSDLSALQNALEMYYQDYGRYPSSSNTYTLSPAASGLDWGSSWQPYIGKLPKDPLSTNTYVYFSPASGNGQTYYLYANLQRGIKDAQSCNGGNACTSFSLSGFPSSNACGGLCNYGISSPNVSP
jgi:general secretion pathway protein G